MEEPEDQTIYKVVLNHEEQYSIWQMDRDNPPGWRDEGKHGTKQECLDHIDKVWTDMRPLSLRQWMEAEEKNRSEEADQEQIPIDTSPDLVTRLSEGKHPVVVSLRPEATVGALKESIDRDFVHVKFTETRGGTELGFPLNREHADLSQADFDAGQGHIKLVGELKLDFQAVRCVAEIDLATLAGEGWLERL